MPQSWRLDELKEREVTRSVVSTTSTTASARTTTATPSAKKSAAEDDDEYDFSAPTRVPKQPSKGQQAVPKVQQQPLSSDHAASGAEPVREPDLLNPCKFVLVRIPLKRHSGQPLGFAVTYVASGVFKVVNVDADEAASKAGVEKGLYLWSVDGKRIRSEADLKEIERSPKRSFRVVFARKRSSPLQPDSFPLPPPIERKSGHEYLFVRLDPTDATRVGTGIGERGGIVFITQILEGSAGQKAGLRVGDRLLAVDDVRVDNRDKCKTLVQQAMGNPFDMVIERAPPKPAPPPPAAAPVSKPAPAPPPPDPDAGDPTAGVPSIPEDVSVFVDSRAKKALVSIRHTAKKKKKVQVHKGEKSKSPKSSVGSSPRSVRMVKKIESKKLHQNK